MLHTSCPRGQAPNEQDYPMSSDGQKCPTLVKPCPCQSGQVHRNSGRTGVWDEVMDTGGVLLSLHSPAVICPSCHQCGLMVLRSLHCCRHKWVSHLGGSGVALSCRWSRCFGSVTRETLMGESTRRVWALQHRTGAQYSAGSCTVFHTHVTRGAILLLYFDMMHFSLYPLSINLFDSVENPRHVSTVW